MTKELHCYIDHVELMEGQLRGTRHPGPVEVLSGPGADKFRTMRRKGVPVPPCENSVAALVTRCHYTTTKFVFMLRQNFPEHNRSLSNRTGCASLSDHGDYAPEKYHRQWKRLDAPTDLSL